MLQRAMSSGLGGCWRSRRSGRYFAADDEEGDQAATLGFKPRRGRKNVWRAFWRRMCGRRVAAPAASYDEYSYADNFEERGSCLWTEEPDHLPRSFSAVYANPSGFLSRFER